MTELRILCRVVTYTTATRSILLVRNRGQKWWCAPGGGWNYSQETLLECAKREAFEETGIRVSILKFLYAQTLEIKSQNSVWLEQFWLAEPADRTEIPHDHIDQYGIVDEARWFTLEEMSTVTVYPEVLKSTFWEIIDKLLLENNHYIGHFVL